jgi:methionyl aminopeptidase
MGRLPVVPHLSEAERSVRLLNNRPRKSVPPHIVRPPYAASGHIPNHDPTVFHDIERHNLADRSEYSSIAQMRQAAQLARQALDLVCEFCTRYDPSEGNTTTNDLDTMVHEFLIQNNAYPSPLNYSHFPKSICTSINEIICHGIPDERPLQLGDVLSIDVSCYTPHLVHGDNCATVIVGDYCEDYHGDDMVNWQGIQYRRDFPSDELECHFLQARHLVKTTRAALLAAIATCRPGSCLSEIGNVIQDLADANGYGTIEKYRGHGIGTEFHRAPFVKHCRNQDKLELQPGMIFTIEPMLIGDVTGQCTEWTSDGWTVSTVDGSLSAQFEHTILITDEGSEILTLPKIEASGRGQLA